MLLRQSSTLIFFCILFFLPGHSQEGTRLLRHPAISADHIAFVYANDLWVSDHNGDQVRRLTAFPGTESLPHFSPDGKWIAFSGEYDGNTDIYLIPVEGGEPIRKTWHPGADLARGWNVTGSDLLFVSGRTNAPYPIPDQLWTLNLDARMPQRFILPRAFDGMFSPDGKQFVFQEIFPWESEWRNYRGGQNRPVQIFDLKSHTTTKLPWENSNDKSPVWLDDQIFFLSDRDFVHNIWSYHTGTGELTQVTFFKELDCKNLNGSHGKLIFENGGHLYTMEASGGTPEKLHIEVKGDFSWARPHWEEVSKSIRSWEISPSGKRAVFEARGEIFTVPAKKGDIRNLTRQPGSAERTPAWSPDGQSISYFSDASGEYTLVIADQYGEVRKEVTLPDPTFFYTPVWSPDSKKLSFTDADRNLYYVNIETGDVNSIDNEGFAHPVRTIYPAWSPDSRWIAYTKRLQNEYNAIFLYSLDDKTTTRLTDGMSDCVAPAWDASGKYVYFMGSTNYGLNVGWLDMSSIERPIERSIYCAVLSKDEPSPLAPESDEEEVDEDKDEEMETDGDNAEEDKKGEIPDVNIDFDQILQRIISLDIPARNYQTLKAGREGVIFFTESVENTDANILHTYSLEDRKVKQYLDAVLDFEISADGTHLLYGGPGNQYGIVKTDGDPKSGDGALDLSDMQMWIDPAAEWAQIFHEAVRYQRDYFYVENVHGLDLDWARETYGAWLEDVRHRSDLTHILDILGGETAIGHSFTGGGDIPDVDRVPIGLLGADYTVEDGMYRIEKIYTGENWNPDLRAPLTGPGIDVNEGEYIVAVNGEPVTSERNIYAFFDQTANKQITITINDNPSLEGARDMTVVPVSSENSLRQFDWVENNRRKVDALSDGQLAYVWLPNTSNAGYNYFNRYYFAQKDKKGAIIDERFNQGGYIADYIVDLLARDLMGYFNNPVGDKQPFTAPNAALWGPKVMIVNEMAGSGGDMLPHMFKMRNIGPVIGTTTWGGLVGIWDVPPLIDGGYITAPRGGYYNVDGEWDVENEGVEPDIHVEQVPEKVIKGHDPQLERAVETALELLKTEEVKLLPQPKDPERVKRPGRS